MKKSASVMNRLIAALLAAVMVFGMLPTPAFATGTEEEAAVHTLTARLVRTAAEVPAEANAPVAPVETTTPAASEENNEMEDPEGGVDEAAEAAEVEAPAVYTYSYQVIVTVDGQEVDADILWALGSQTEKITVDTDVDAWAGLKTIDAGEEATVTVLVSYDGMEMQLSNDGEDEKSLEWGAKDIIWPATLYMGIPTNSIDVATVLKPGCFAAPTETDAFNNEYLTFVEGSGYVAKKAMAQGVLYTKTFAGNSGAIYCKQEGISTISYPTYTVTYTYDADGTAVESGKWHATAPVINIKVVAPGVIGKLYLPYVLVNDASRLTAWTPVEGEDFTWTTTVQTGIGTNRISYPGCEEVVVNVDAAPLTVAVSDLYYNGQGEDRTTTYTVTYTAGLSDVTFELLDAEDNVLDTWTRTAQEDKTFTRTYAGVLEVVKIHMTNQAGAFAEAVSESAPQEAMSIEFAENIELIPESDIYLNKDKAQTVTAVIKGIDEGKYALAATTIVAKDQNGNDVAFTQEGGVITFDLTNGLSSLSVTASDAAGRSVTATYGATYKVDREAPVVTVSRSMSPANTANGTSYFDSLVTYVFTISDELMAPGAASILYTVNGEQKQVVFEEGKAQFTLQHNDYLSRIFVSASDMSGNTVTNVIAQGVNAPAWPENSATYDCSEKVDIYAPVVNAVLSDNVTEFFEKDGHYYAVVNPVKDNSDERSEGSETVSLTIFVKDDNILPENLTAEGAQWTHNAEAGTYSVTFSVVVDDHKTALLPFSFSVKDAANIPAVNTLVITTQSAHEGFNAGFLVTPENGTYAKEFRIDRRAPQTEGNSFQAPPQIGLSTMTAHYMIDNGFGQTIDLYTTGTISFDMKVVDQSSDDPDAAYDSGLASVTWTVTDGLGNGFLSSACDGKLTEDGKYYITINANGYNETNSAVLTIVVADHVGNTYTYFKTFGVDTLAPRIDVKYDNEEVENGKFYDAGRTATVTITDLNLAAYTIKMNGQAYTAQPGENNSVTCTLSCLTDGEYQIDITAADHELESEKHDYFVVDKTAPVITVEKTTGAFQKDADGVDFYNGEVTYDITVSDQFLNLGEGTVEAKVIYEDGTNAVIELTKTTNKETLESVQDVYTGSFTVKDGQVVADIVINVLDNAGNPAELNVVDDEKRTAFAVSEDDGCWHYQGNLIAVDGTAPEVKVTKTVADGGKFVQTYEGVDYYSANVTYTFELTDNFLTAEGGVAEVTVTYLDGSQETIALELIENGDTLAAAADSWKAQLLLDETKVITGIIVNVKDNAGNAANLTCDDELTTFTQDENGLWNYTGNDVVVDTTAPVVNMTFSNNVKSFFVNQNTGSIYVVMENPVVNKNGEAQVGEYDKNVTVTVTVKDNNLAVGNGVTTETYKWTGETGVNQATTLTLVADEAITADTTKILKLDLNIKDLAGNVPVSFQSTPTKIDGTILNVAVDAEGHIDYTLYMDNKRPGSIFDEGAPRIVVNPSIIPTATESGLDLFDNAFSFDLFITDGSAEADSGVQYVTWTLTDANGVVDAKSFAVDYGTEPGKYTENYTIPVENLGNADESNEVTLIITARDFVGNEISFKKVFGYDDLAPRISYTYTDAEGVSHQLEEGQFFQDPVDITVSIEDLNMDAELVKLGNNFINVTEYIKGYEQGTGNTVTIREDVYALENLPVTQDGNVYSYKLTFTKGGEYGITTNATDRANNQADEKHTNFTLDMTPPVITFTKTLAEGAELVNSLNGVDFYSGEVTYLVTISDNNLSGGAAQANLYYTFEDGTEELVSLGMENGWNVETTEDKVIYSHEFTVTDGQVLTGLSIQAMDNASNAAAVVENNDPENTAFVYLDGYANTHIYGGIAVVDTTAPVITVEKTIAEDGKFVQDYQGYDYYNAPVTYTFQVTDLFLDLDVAKADVIVTWQDGTVETITLTKAEAESDAIAAEDAYSASFTVNDGNFVKSIQLDVKDNAGNRIAPEKDNLTVTDADKRTAFVFDEETGLWNYTGNPVVVDTVLPEVTVEFSKNVKSVYYNTRSKTIYLVMSTPVSGPSGEALVNDEMTATVTFRVNDLNLTKDEENIHGVKSANEFSWTNETPVNEPTTLVLEASSAKVGVDNTYYFTVDLDIADLAGNLPESFETALATIDNTVFSIDVADGHIGYNISLDRRRPDSGIADLAAPTIEVKPSITPTVNADGNDLFANDFQFALHVTDGEDTSSNSGVRYLSWTLVDANGVVANDSFHVDYNGAAEYTEDYLINVARAVAAGESNDVTLTITAEDFVGNCITYQKVFGYDNLAPRVTIQQSNTSVQNEFYFNDDQHITVTIEDLNFEPETSTVTTEVNFKGWTSMGENVYRTVLDYTVDGDYTFAMATTDKANNEAAIDYETGLIALKSFTIDKTAPVITVTYNPPVAVDTDDRGVQYFDMARTVTVTIDEHNFDANDVVSDLGAVNALGFWGTNGDLHTASSTFNEGNNYQVSVSYTDLAGNPAVPYTSPVFSVDLHEPTITMTTGNIQKGQPIADDLILGYTINDAQNNLKDFSVELLFLNSEFKMEKVEGAEYYITSRDERTNGYVNFTNIAKEKLNDGIYTVRITARDYAGHVVNMPDLVFSLNRYGSTFMIEDAYTANFLTADESGIVFRSAVENNLVIKEINPDQVWQDAAMTKVGSEITVSVNGNAMKLAAGTDYTVTVNEKGTGGDTWFEYIYSIKPTVFQNNGELVDGEYTIFFYSQDDAGNKNTNEANEGSQLQLGADGTYSGKISFTLDHKLPVVTILGIEEGDKLFEANKSVEINVADNTPVSIYVYINDVLVELIETGDGQPLNSDWIYYDESTGSYMLNMSEKDVPQNVRVVVVDAAGNELETIVADIMLTEDLMAQFVNSLPAQLTAGVIGIGLIVLIVALIKKRKKNPANV